MNKRADNEANIDRQPDSDLDWLAWCFVTGELADDQALEFQLRLVSEPEVVLAVERAIDLFGDCETGLDEFDTIPSGLADSVFADGGATNGRVQLVKTEQAASRSRSWRLTAVLTMAAVALLAVSIVMRWSGEAAMRAHDENMLAALWSEEVVANDSIDFGLMLDEDFDAMLAGEIESPLASDADGQSWIFAAAVALEGVDFDSGMDDEQVF